MRLPLLATDAKFGFNEFNRRAGDFAMSAALVTYRLQGGKITKRASASAAPSRSRAALRKPKPRSNGQAPGDKVFRAAAEAAAKAIDPLEDHQTNADYRRDLVRAVVRRALEHSA